MAYNYGFQGCAPVSSPRRVSGELEISLSGMVRRLHNRVKKDLELQNCASRYQNIAKH